jgi:hypothetical protein
MCWESRYCNAGPMSSSPFSKVIKELSCHKVSADQVLFEQKRADQNTYIGWQLLSSPLSWLFIGYRSDDDCICPVFFVRVAIERKFPAAARRWTICSNQFFGFGVPPEVKFEGLASLAPISGCITIFGVLLSKDRVLKTFCIICQQQIRLPTHMATEDSRIYQT